MASTQPAVASPATTFHDFRRLPLELRAMIWHLAARQVRVVEVGMVRAEYKGGGRIKRFTSKALTPSILHACGESRWMGFKRYEKVTLDGIFTGSYVNWDVDYIGFRSTHYWDTRSLLRRFRYRSGSESCEVIQNCRRLVAFPDRDHQYLAVHHLRYFKSLEELVFLFPGDFGGWSRLSGNIKLAPMTDPEPHEQSKLDDHTSEDRLRLIRRKIPGFKEFSAMRFFRAPDRHLSFPEDTGRGVLYPDEALLLSKPELPKRVSFKSYRLPELRNAANDLRLSDKDEALFREEMRQYQQDMVEYSAKIDKLFAEPKKPGRKNYTNHTKKKLRRNARKKGLYGHGSTKDLVARLQAWWEPGYLEKREIWKQEMRYYQRMLRRVARREFF
ncbi:hypothetical protein DL98DRAFT_567147 [Cadophora sp. DSE1049]|nr:hypothetical protein DL98DRAFT_567147 [Cadophora sp. DSE1049]